MRVWLSAEGAKTFPGLSYVSPENGVVWLKHLRVNLYLLFYHKHSRFTGQQKKEKGISLTPHYHFYLLYRQLDISWAITVESLPLHIASSQNQTGNLEPCNTYIHIHTYIYILYIIYIYNIYINIHIYIYIYNEYYLHCREKKKIIHSAMETWKYAEIIRNFIILSLCPFSKISHPPWLRASYASVYGMT